VTLWPDAANKPDLSVSATCHVTKEDNGTTKAYTSIKCDALAKGECTKMALSTAGNTCTEFGYIASPPRSALHLEALQPFWRDYYKPVAER